MSGEAKMNAGVVSPHEIVHAYSGDWEQPAEYNMDLETMWKMLPDKVQGDSSTLVIRDGSGSMTATIGRQTSASCLDVATAMSIYFAERQTGPLANKFITFSANPEIVDMSRCDSLHDKLELCVGQLRRDIVGRDPVCDRLDDHRNKPSRFQGKRTLSVIWSLMMQPKNMIGNITNGMKDGINPCLKPSAINGRKKVMNFLPCCSGM